jgi:hypothetical protein
MPVSSFLRGGPPQLGPSQGAPPTVPSAPPLAPTPPSERSSALSVIAGVGVLVLAVGVGVLIGHADKTRVITAPAQVVTVSTPGTSAPAAVEAAFTSSWPSGTSGYTVQLQTLPQPGSSISTVDADKTSATAKGAKAVGALKSEEFSSLPAGSYVIYSGIDHTRAEADKALTGLRKSFPGARVIHVTNGGSSGAGAEPAGGSGGGSSLSHPAPLPKDFGKSKGKNYEEQSKNLPDVVETR